MRKLFQGLCLVSLFIGCRSVSSDDSKSLANEPPNKELKNYSGSIVCYPQKILLPKSLLEVQDAVRRAAVAKKNVRVISLASSRSYSPVICPEVGGTVINVEALNKIISIDSKALTAIVQPGILVGDLQDQLDEKGFTFPVTPDYNGVSLAGGMGTGAHHSSLRFATGISDWIDEIKVIDGRGDLQTISGKDLETARVHLG
ncbi:MAG: FAD-binding oxidoreductase, partial [Proteobacteria bacterium]